VATEVLVMLVTVQLSRLSFDTSFMSLLRCYRPALVSSTIMGACVIGSKTLLDNQSSMPVLLVAIATGIASYYLATRLLFLKELQTTLRTVLGDRLAFLAPRRNQS
jgi:uncharacterized membrane protein